jgi:hypothetical protein
MSESNARTSAPAYRTGATLPPAAASRLDPVRFCAMTTVALIAWVIGPPACLMVMSALGLWAYARAMRAGLRESRCVLRRPALVLGYLALTFLAGAGGLAWRLLS